jgi:Ca2+-binding RTX toxin-like protein
MATVNWPKSESGYKDATQRFQDYGFDLRDILLTGVASPTFINRDGTGFTNYETAHTFLTNDVFSGSFVVKREGTEYGTPSASIFVGSEWVESGTITSFTRSAGGITLGSIKGIRLDYKQAAAAALTASKSDDMALWAKAFAGNDVLTGSAASDRLEGFAGNDKLTGKVGADKLYGGAGADTFIFASTKDSTVTSSGRDMIYDFSSGQKDKIDLRTIDASTKTTGNNMFKYISTQDFHKKAGELRWEKVTSGTFVYGDTNGDGKADFSIFLKDVAKLSSGDFVL